MPAPKEIEELVKKFENNRDELMLVKYNEAQLRQEYLDEFFAALGWDMRNKQGFAEAYKEVIHEDAIKIGGSTKAPDYCFRIGGVRKFFVEAKKPSVNIADDVKPAFQLRRYAWSANMPVGILTDFDEFAVYDTRIKPKKTDSPKVGRLMYFKCSQFLEKWDEIASVFSKDAILKGSFDRYSQKKKKGSEPVDHAFLEEIEQWRKLLAKSIAEENTNLSQKELNIAVQKIIDRIIFLRICEDRGIEPMGALQGLQNGTNNYRRLTELFKKAEIRYDSGLFHFAQEKEEKAAADSVTLKLKIPDEVIKKLLKNLYFPESPYEFSVLPPEILGHVYEQFLGKVIELNSSHQAKIVEKPEVRKAGGVYYTPAYIVAYIVKNTVGKLVDGKTPNQVSKLTIVDPACGSGSFLIGAYQFLLDWHLTWYTDNGGLDKWAKGKGKTIYDSGPRGWQLTLEERKRILINNIYGVDLDAQAVEVSKLSLLLKVLEGETQPELLMKRALPDLGNNIKCGNSLIGWDYFNELINPDQSEIDRVNPFDWKAQFAKVFQRGGFDVVIGNPPYGAKLSNNDQKYLLRKHSINTTDTAGLFIAEAVKILAKTSSIGFIVPKSISYSSKYESLRNLFTTNLVELVDCNKVWSEVKLEQIVLFFDLSSKSLEYRACVRRGQKIESVGTVQKKDCELFGFWLNNVSPSEIGIAKKIISSTINLGQISTNTRGGMIQKELRSTGKHRVVGGINLEFSTVTGEKGFVDQVTAQNSKVLQNSLLVQNIVAHLERPIDHTKIIATVVEDDSFLILDTVNQIHLGPGYSPYAIWAILISPIVNWYLYRFVFARAIRTMHFDNTVTDKLPIPKDLLNKQSQIEKSAKKVLAHMRSHDVSGINREQQLVSLKFALFQDVLSAYDLDPNDRRIIDAYSDLYLK